MRRTWGVWMLGAFASLWGCSGDSGGSSNDAPDLSPTISSVADQTISANSVANEVSFSVGDDMTSPAALSIAVSTENPELLSEAGLALEGEGEQRILLLTPTAGQTGEASITLVVSDSAAQSTEIRFLVSVVPQQLSFSDVVRDAFSAAANATPISINDKELIQNESEFSDLLDN
ncbi:MAG: hypothetical protein AB8B57_14800 [Congregibacter sp.]